MGVNHELIVKNILKYRTGKNVTQKELASLLKIAPNSLSAIECGRKCASINMLLKISEILNVKVDSLLEGTVNHPRHNEIGIDGKAKKMFYEELQHATIDHKEKILNIINYYIENMRTSG